MQPVNIRLYLIIPCFVCFSAFSLLAQDCASVIKENKKISGIQIANSASLTVVVRGGYNYSIEFFTNEKGIFARMTSVGGIEFNQDDQVAFIDATGKEQSYKFIGMDELMTGTVPTHRNNLRLDLEAMQWLSNANLTGINFIRVRRHHQYNLKINA